MYRKLLETSGEDGGSDGCIDIEAWAVAGRGDMFSSLVVVVLDLDIVLRLYGVLLDGESMSDGGREMETRLRCDSVRGAWEIG